MICAILLAAGASRRMGTNKLLLPYGDESVIRHILKTLREGGVNEIVVVTGNDPQVLHDELRGFSVRFAHNADFETGMLSSVRCGLKSLPDTCEAALVALGDHPTLDAGVIRRMIAAKRFGAQIVVPSFHGRRGHPLLISMSFADSIMTRYENCGLRGLLQEYAPMVVEIECDNNGATLDMDTREDYAALLGNLRKGKEDS